MTEQLALKGGSPLITEAWPQWPVWDHRESQVLQDALQDSHWGIDCEKVKEFERKFAELQSAKFGIAVTSGTTALMVALRAAGVAAGDEVIVPDYTFMASAAAVLSIGALPIPVDVEPQAYNIDPASVGPMVGNRTKAIMPVHFAGLPAEMDKVNELARKHNLKVVEDAAQAVGAAWKETPVGALGDAGCFSFQSSKNVTSGEGGIILTNDENLALQADMYRNCGRDLSRVWYRHYLPGYNFRLTVFQAAILLSQMERLPEQMGRRDKSARALSEALGTVPGVIPAAPPSEGARHAWHLYVLRYQPEEFSDLKKAKFVEALRAEGVPCSGGYLFGIHELDFMQNHECLRQVLGRNYDAKRLHFPAGSFPNTDRAVKKEAVWLPQKALLASPEKVLKIAEAIEKIRRLSHTINE